VISMIPPQQALRRSLERFELRPASIVKCEKEAAVSTFADKMRRNLIIVSHVQSWMELGVTIDPNDILKLFDCIERLVHLMEYSFSAILFPMLIYAERFVRKTQQLRRSELFPLLVVSACLALKMWEDYGPDLQLTVQVCNITKKFIKELERKILSVFDYRLLISTVDVDAFKSDPLPTFSSP